MMRRKNIFLTGSIHSGKSTIINKVIDRLPGFKIYGFRTIPIFENGIKKGFYLKSFDGFKKIFAHTDLKQTEQFDIYNFDYAVFEGFGVSILRQALLADDVIVMDEIGMMEKNAATFCTLINECLDAPKLVLGAFQKRATWFLKILENRVDTKIFPVSDANRNALPDQILSLIRQDFCITLQ